MTLNIRFHHYSGFFFILASICLGLGWLWMPIGPDQKSDFMMAIWAHFFTSCSLIIAVVILQTDRRASCSKTMRVGAIMILIGLIGLNINVISQSLLYHATSLEIAQQDLRTFNPYLFTLSAVLFVGSTVYSAGGYHIDATSPWSKRIFLIALAWLLMGWPLAGSSGQSILIMGFRALNVLAYCWFGFEVLFRFRPDQFKYKWSAAKPAQSS